MRPTRRSLFALLLLIAAVAFGGGAWQRWRDGRAGEQLASLARPGDIAMVSSESCAYCARARAYFTEHRVPFTECFIERDADCAARYQALLAPGTPVLVVRGERQVGFSAQRVADALQ